MDQETAERLLGGLVPDPQDGPRPVASLLTAARAAPHPDELTGEEAAVRAYRLARAGNPPVLPSVRRPALAGFGVRAALAGVALALTGGVALAATGGALPHPLRAPAPTTAPAHSPTADASRTAAPDRPPAPTGGVQGRPEPDAAVRKSCQDYRAGGGDASDDAAFADLIRAAGGREEVPGYCERVLADEPGTPVPHGSPSDRPGAAPTERPGAAPTERPGASPTGRPGAGATGRPGADPTGRPGAGPTAPRPAATETPTRPSRSGPADVPPAQGPPPPAAPTGVDAG
ncbi:hypothetical protein V6U77_21540 [Micromonospora sp. CPCC 205546]|uniref:hypothetical protein n=1 Tax=Micromonospora sp. CPCC 205546 TaxID=3122397 RepID=UPI002FF04651